MDTVQKSIRFDNLLFESDPSECSTYEFNLLRNEYQFKDFLSLLFSEALAPKSISMSFMAKKWMNTFMKSLLDVSYNKNSLKNLERLRISNSNIPQETLLALLQSPMLENVKELNLSSNPLTIYDATIKEINNFAHLKTISILILKNNKQITDRTLEFLSLPLLRSLNLSNCSITDQGLPPLSKNLPHLQSLNLSRNHEIVNFENLPFVELKELELAFCKLEANFVKNIVKAGINKALVALNFGNLASYDPRTVIKTIIEAFSQEDFKKLERLSLENVCIEDEDLNTFLEGFPKLNALNLNNNRFLSNKCLIPLRKLKDLRYLGLENCQLIGENFEKNMQESFSFTSSLIYLNINNNLELKDQGFSFLLKIATAKNTLVSLFTANCSLTLESPLFLKKNEDMFINLRLLNLRGNNCLGNEGFKVLTICDFFKMLEFLNVSDCGLDDKSIDIMLENKPLNGFLLKDLRVAQNKITYEGLAKLFVRFIDDFKKLERVAMGSYECLDEFDGKKEMEERGIVVVPLIGDNYD